MTTTTATGTAATGEAATGEAATTADVSAGVAVINVRVTTFRGQRDGYAEEADALRTLDGEESTYWTTAGLGAGDATVNGVGLVFRLAEPARLSRMTVTSDTRGWTAAVYTAEEDFDRLSDWGVLFDQQTNHTGPAAVRPGRSGSGRRSAMDPRSPSCGDRGDSHRRGGHLCSGGRASTLSPSGIGTEETFAGIPCADGNRLGRQPEATPGCGTPTTRPS